MRAKAAKGLGLGKTPFGYRIGSEGLFEPVPEEAKIVRGIYKLYLNEGIGVRSIARLLNTEGYRTRRGADWSMDGRVLTTVFEKPSLRTKASLELAAKLLGGHVLSFGAHEVQIGEREPIEDVARVISRMSDVLAMRVFQHETLVSASHASDIPI